MSGREPAFERATALAKSLFKALDATLVLMSEDRVWRSMDRRGKMTPQDPASARVISTGKSLWIQDCRKDAEFRSHPLVAGPPHIRAYVGAPVILADGSTLGVLCVACDTPRRRNPELLAHLERLTAFVADECDRARVTQALAKGGRELQVTRGALAAFVDAVPASVIMTDRDMCVIEASARWLQDFNITQDQARGRSVYDISPKFFNQYKEIYTEALAGKPFSANRVRSPQRDGSIRYFRGEVTPWRDHNGEIGGLVSVALDITDLVEAHRRVERSEQRLNLAAEIASLHVWELDYTRGVLEQAGADAELFGRELTYEQLFDNTSSTIHPDDRDRIAAEWDKAVREGRRYYPEYRVARDDDKEVWAACAVKLITNERGEPKRLIGAMQNITARKLAEAELVKAKEEAEAANKAKSAFLATMSHEIRTPLNGVLGMAQAMSGAALEPVQRERLEIIRQSGESLLAILNDVLDLSKIEAGKLELEMAEFDIAELARGAYAAFTEIANRKGLSFALVVEEEARGVYCGDGARLRQILYNLVSNALKFTDEGEVRVRVSRPDNLLTLSVADTGIGVEPERLAQLFGKFEQADVSTTRRYGGTGLGLAICRELAELMGGAVDAESRPGQGATFTVTVPVERVGDSVAVLAPEGHAALEPHSAANLNLRVLAAEDNAINQLVLRTLLHQAGIDPVIVGDGAQALQAWRDGVWDVILMDVQMPVMDGPTATVAIRAEEARSGRARTPIIALTANAMAHQVAEYHGVGMDGFVAKPIEISRLFAAIEAVLPHEGDAAQALAS